MKAIFKFPNTSFVYCLIPKNACTTIRYSLFLNSGEGKVLSKGIDVYPYIIKYQIPIANRCKEPILFIHRDPLRRYMSSYLHKLCFSYMKPHSWTIKEFRKKRLDMSFNEYMNHLSLKKQTNHHFMRQDELIPYDKNNTYYPIPFEDLPKMKYIVTPNDKIKLIRKDPTVVTSQKDLHVDNDLNIMSTSLELYNFHEKNNYFPVKQLLEDAKQNLSTEAKDLINMENDGMQRILKLAADLSDRVPHKVNMLGRQI